MTTRGLIAIVAAIEAHVHNHLVAARTDVVKSDAEMNAQLQGIIVAVKPLENIVMSECLRKCHCQETEIVEMNLRRAHQRAHVEYEMSLPRLLVLHVKCSSLHRG